MSIKEVNSHEMATCKQEAVGERTMGLGFRGLDLVQVLLVAFSQSYPCVKEGGK